MSAFPAQVFTLDDLVRILREGSGISKGIELGSDILDTEFYVLGYDSLAVLETASRIEREYGIALEDALLTDTVTPRAFLEAINAQAVAHSA